MTTAIASSTQADTVAMCDEECGCYPEQDEWTHWVCMGCEDLIPISAGSKVNFLCSDCEKREEDDS